MITRHAFPWGPTLKLACDRGERGEGGGGQASCLVTKQAVEFHRYWLVYKLAATHITCKRGSPRSAMIKDTPLSYRCVCVQRNPFAGPRESSVLICTFRAELQCECHGGLIPECPRQGVPLYLSVDFSCV